MSALAGSAEEFSKSSAGPEEPIVLVCQREWIDEPTPGHFHAKATERITEWRVKWLAGIKRGTDTVRDFVAHPKPESWLNLAISFRTGL